MPSLRSLLVLLRLGPRRLALLVRHLPNFLLLFWRLLKDPRVAVGPKLLFLAGPVYLVLPLDLVPDFLPLFGQVDDLMLIFLLCWAFVRLCPREVVREHVAAIAAGR